jgi:ATP-dependent helicase/nuclease subunit B
MNSIASSAVDGAFWPRLADQVQGWLAAQGAAPRDAIVLLPHAGLLGVARAAFAARGGWQPRVETAQTLAAALAPPAPAAPGLPSGDRTTDRLQASSLLRGIDLDGIERDPRSLHAVVAAFVATANDLLEASAQQAPPARPAWWDGLRAALLPGAGPGASERRLARMALEWAAAADAPATDLLRDLAPSAWVVLEAGGVDPGALLPAAASRVLRLQADAPHPFDAVADLPAPRCLLADGLEDEACTAALAVVEALDDGAGSIALIGQDRLVLRRIRALLERVGVTLDDETGWTLSTTRAAARLMAWLRAAAPGAGRDACIEALRAERAPGHAVDALESAWRRQRPPPPHAQGVDDDRRQRIAAWDPTRTRPLAAWLAALREAAPRLLDGLAADAAGRQVLDLLGLTDAEPPWHPAAQDTAFDLAQFIAWVDDTLEGSAWRPTPAAPARVSIVPLARALLRPFDAVVFPGCDARHLGAGDVGASLLPAAVAREFGVVDATQRRAQELRAFAHLLRVPRLTLLRRAQEGSEALAPSPLLERALLARRRLGAAVPQEQAVQLPRQRVPAQPVHRPAPTLADALPPQLSATTAQLLRDCPYRFFARVALGLNDADELEAALDNSDYGRWMHGLLYRFHAGPRPGGGADFHALLAAADAEQQALALDAAALWPYRASFESFARRYLEWLRQHEAAGWRFDGGEVERRCEPAALGGIALAGRLDRIDARAGGGTLLIDYKTGQRDKLVQRVNEPAEDTQLAFYAALLDDGAAAAPPLRAFYLALSERRLPEPIEHQDVASSAALLVEGMGADLQALRGGAGAPALGEGEVCRHCEARGLCRRDHWAPAEGER